MPFIKTADERNKITEVLLRQAVKIGCAARNVPYQVDFLGTVKRHEIPLPCSGILCLHGAFLICGFAQTGKGRAAPFLPSHEHGGIVGGCCKPH